MKAPCELRSRGSLMNIGREVDYAVRALSYMAARFEEGPVRRVEICAAQNIPPHYLAKILRKAVNAGLVASGVGPRGGFWLAVSPGEITIRTIYECVNGHLCLVECLASPSGCPYVGVCPQVTLWSEAQATLLGFLDSVNLESLSDREGLVTRLPADEGKNRSPA